MKSNTSAVERMVQAAIDGGWKGVIYDTCSHCEELAMSPCSTHIERALLDPNFWSAAGKTLGWAKRSKYYMDDHQTRKYGTRARYNMHLFIDHLADGHDINSALEKVI